MAKKDDPLESIIPTQAGPLQEPGVAPDFDPQFIEPDDSDIPIQSIQMTPACVGSVGGQPFLDDVERQLVENYNAERESRRPTILPIRCRMPSCDNADRPYVYHAENQLDTTTFYPGTQFEGYAYDRIAPRPSFEPVILSDLLATAIDSVRGHVDNN
jgi:hypothetical protein